MYSMFDKCNETHSFYFTLMGVLSRQIFKFENKSNFFNCHVSISSIINKNKLLCLTQYVRYDKGEKWQYKPPLMIRIDFLSIHWIVSLRGSEEGWVGDGEGRRPCDTYPCHLLSVWGVMEITHTGVHNGVPPAGSLVLLLYFFHDVHHRPQAIWGLYIHLFYKSPTA